MNDVTQVREAVGVFHDRTQFQAAIVPIQLFQQIQDILRDHPLPHKLSNPVLQAMTQVRITNVTVGPTEEQGQ